MTMDQNFLKLEYSKDIIEGLLYSYMKEKFYPLMKFIPRNDKFLDNICMSSIHPKGTIILPEKMEKRFYFDLQKNSKNVYTVKKGFGSQCNKPYER